MDRHVTDGTAAIIPPAPPAERDKGAVVVALGSWAEPQIPLKVFRNGRLVGWEQDTLRPPFSGPIGDDVNLADRPDGVALEHLDQSQVTWVLVVLGTHLGGDTFFFGKCCDDASFLDGMGQRFLAVDMQTAS